MLKRTECTSKGFTITHVEAPNGLAYPNSVSPALNELHLEVSCSKLPGLVWNLMIPENFLGKGKDARTGFRPVLGMKWLADKDRLWFDWLHYRGNVELMVTTEVRIESEDSIVYCITVRNDSAAPLEHLNSNACFNHWRTPQFGRDVFVLTETGWLRTIDAPEIPPPGIPYFVVKDREARWRQAQQEIEHWPIHPTVKPVVGLSATTGRCGDTDFTLAHGSPDVVMLWHNVRNPCTDLWHWFGTVKPGETKHTTGRLYFLEGQKCLDRLLERFRSDLW